MPTTQNSVNVQGVTFPCKLYSELCSFNSQSGYDNNTPSYSCCPISLLKLLLLDVFIVSLRNTADTALVIKCFYIDTY